MLLAYIDETYRRGSQFWVSALVLPGDWIAAVSDAMDAVVARASEKFDGIEKTAELHGYEIDAGTGHWEPLKGQARARVGVYTDAIETIAQFGDLAWFRGGINEKAWWSETQDPHEWALKFLLERINSEAYARGEYVLCICDDVHNRDKYRERLQHYREYGTGGYASSKLGRIVDTLHFAPSCHSRMVQAVDLVTYVLNRHQHPAENPRTAAFYQGLWDMLEPLRSRGVSRFWPTNT
ncbi:DUF3800 domain-containing protein [Nocardia sp. NPDC004711]